MSSSIGETQQPAVALPVGAGDRRRAQLLAALDELLKHQSVDSISIGDITTVAGVTRSGFYFYFDNKAAAVAALMTETYQEVVRATADLFVGEGSPRVRIETSVRGLVDVWKEHRTLYLAMLEARQTNPAVRDLWDAQRGSFIAPVAAMIDAERAAGAAVPGPDSRALATVLLDLNDHTLERIAQEDPMPIADRIDVLVVIWLRTIYGAENPS